ncbi:Peroxidase 5 [Acorus gramineus]|uniref:Peroxidase n=1 Tax=Acorus gramineus TaxID=55184 RepID=A0AAV9BMN9_ACOGR|nr:Peroxidase 5 [Acorus gramineus]
MGSNSAQMVLKACFLFAVFATLSTSLATLQVGFYQHTCPQAEAIVRRTVAKAFSRDHGVTGGLIRMHFHDCFVRGCDASILLDSLPGIDSEKMSPVNNPSLRGYEVIDEAKSTLEHHCPQTVSCADIIAFAARDSAFVSGGIDYQVPSGRRDGRVSLAPEVLENLPPPTFNADQLKARFLEKGLSAEEMVTLSGAHSIGVSHCSSFNTRLYNFHNVTHAQDPSMDPSFAAYLKTRCPPPSMDDGVDPIAPLDFATPYRLDNKYYKNLKRNRGLLTSDQTLMSDRSTANMVNNNARHGSYWAAKFGEAMVRMGSIDVLTGSQGEIRKRCGVVNYY